MQRRAHSSSGDASWADPPWCPQFGKYKRTAQPGFNCVVCCAGGLPALLAALAARSALSCAHARAGEALAGTLSLRVQQLDVRQGPQPPAPAVPARPGAPDPGRRRCETKTLDNVFVNVVVSVQYQVVRDNIYDALCGPLRCLPCCL